MLQETEDPSKKRISIPFEPRKRKGIEQRGTKPDRRQFDFRNKFPKWDDQVESLIGNRKPDNDRRKQERRTGFEERRGQVAALRRKRPLGRRSADFAKDSRPASRTLEMSADLINRPKPEKSEKPDAKNVYKRRVDLGIPIQPGDPDTQNTVVADARRFLPDWVLRIKSTLKRGS
jgi:hypothetical protein